MSSSNPVGRQVKIIPTNRTLSKAKQQTTPVHVTVFHVHTYFVVIQDTVGWSLAHRKEFVPNDTVVFHCYYCIAT